LSIFSDFILVFDFDKTIAKNDVVVDMLDLYGDPGWREKERQVEAGKITLRECIEWELGSLKINRATYERVVGDMVKLDRGAKKLFRWIREKKYPVHIISDSLTAPILYAMVDEKLGNGISYFIDAHEILWNIDGSIKGIKMANEVCKHECANCKISKVENLKLINPKSLIVYIGDGFTDVLAAPKADIIFARKDQYLANLLKEKGIRHYEYSNLIEVREELRRISLSNAETIYPIIHQSQ